MPAVTVTETEPSGSSTSSPAVATVKEAVAALALKVTDFAPRFAAATKLPACPTLRFTFRSASGAGLARTVKDAVPPSSIPAPATMLTVGPPPSSSVIVKLAVPEPLAPPPRLVPEVASRVPSPTVTVSSPSAAGSDLATIRTAAVAEDAAPPVKVTLGVAVARFR